MTQPVLFLSVIINNYNYGRFLREAIDSALAQTWPHREIIVVDDGSTDGSQDIIRSYGDKVIPVLKENGGQGSAFNAGWRQSRGDLILFLDSDDKLFANCLEVVAQRWDPTCVKAHYRLEIRDTRGAYRGAYPALDTPLAQGNVLDHVWKTGFHVSPPCSGNFYSRPLLEKLLPMSEPGFRLGADNNLNIRLPFYGSIVAIDQVLGVYRMHGNNAWFDVSITDDLPKLQYRLKLTASYRPLFLEEALRNGRTDPVPDWPIDPSIQRITMFCRKLDPPKDTRDSPGVARLGWQLLAFTWPQKDISWKEKISHLVYVIVITFSPVWFLNRLRKALPAIKRFTRKRDAVVTPRR
jgi:glycosyltransferase involved in cell wall biosynthesis